MDNEDALLRLRFSEDVSEGLKTIQSAFGVTEEAAEKVIQEFERLVKTLDSMKRESTDLGGAFTTAFRASQTDVTKMTAELDKAKKALDDLVSEGPQGKLRARVTGSSGAPEIIGQDWSKEQLARIKGVETALEAGLLRVGATSQNVRQTMQSVFNDLGSHATSGSRIVLTESEKLSEALYRLSQTTHSRSTKLQDDYASHVRKSYQDLSDWQVKKFKDNQAEMARGLRDPVSKIDYSMAQPYDPYLNTPAAGGAKDEAYYAKQNALAAAFADKHRREQVAAERATRAEWAAMDKDPAVVAAAAAREQHLRQVIDLANRATKELNDMKKGLGAPSNDTELLATVEGNSRRRIAAIHGFDKVALESSTHFINGLTQMAGAFGIVNGGMDQFGQGMRDMSRISTPLITGLSAVAVVATAVGIKLAQIGIEAHDVEKRLERFSTFQGATAAEMPGIRKDVEDRRPDVYRVGGTMLELNAEYRQNVELVGSHAEAIRLLDAQIGVALTRGEKFTEGANKMTSAIRGSKEAIMSVIPGITEEHAELLKGIPIRERTAHVIEMANAARKSQTDRPDDVVDRARQAQGTWDRTMEDWGKKWINFLDLSAKNIKEEIDWLGRRKDEMNAWRDANVKVANETQAAQSASLAQAAAALERDKAMWAERIAWLGRVKEATLDALGRGIQQNTYVGPAVRAAQATGIPDQAGQWVRDRLDTQADPYGFAPQPGDKIPRRPRSEMESDLGQFEQHMTWAEADAAAKAKADAARNLNAKQLAEQKAEAIRIGQMEVYLRKQITQAAEEESRAVKLAWDTAKDASQAAHTAAVRELGAWRDLEKAALDVAKAEQDRRQRQENFDLGQRQTGESNEIRDRRSGVESAHREEVEGIRAVHDANVTRIKAETDETIEGINTRKTAFMDGIRDQTRAEQDRHTKVMGQIEIETRAARAAHDDRVKSIGERERTEINQIEKVRDARLEQLRLDRRAVDEMHTLQKNALDDEIRHRKRAHDLRIEGYKDERRELENTQRQVTEAIQERLRGQDDAADNRKLAQKTVDSGYDMQRAQMQLQRARAEGEDDPLKLMELQNRIYEIQAKQADAHYGAVQDQIKKALEREMRESKSGIDAAQRDIEGMERTANREMKVWEEVEIARRREIEATYTFHKNRIEDAERETRAVAGSQIDTWKEWGRVQREESQNTLTQVLAELETRKNEEAALHTQNQRDLEDRRGAAERFYAKLIDDARENGAKLIAQEKATQDGLIAEADRRKNAALAGILLEEDRMKLRHGAERHELNETHIAQNTAMANRYTALDKAYTDQKTLIDDKLRDELKAHEAHYGEQGILGAIRAVKEQHLLLNDAIGEEIKLNLSDGSKQGLDRAWQLAEAAERREKAYQKILIAKRQGADAVPDPEPAPYLPEQDIPPPTAPSRVSRQPYLPEENVPEPEPELEPEINQYLRRVPDYMNPYYNPPPGVNPYYTGSGGARTGGGQRYQDIASNPYAGMAGPGGVAGGAPLPGFMQTDWRGMIEGAGYGTRFGSVGDVTERMGRYVAPQYGQRDAGSFGANQYVAGLPLFQTTVTTYNNLVKELGAAQQRWTLAGADANEKAQRTLVDLIDAQLQQIDGLIASKGRLNDFQMAVGGAMGALELFSTAAEFNAKSFNPQGAQKMVDYSQYSDADLIRMGQASGIAQPGDTLTEAMRQQIIKYLADQFAYITSGAARASASFLDDWNNRMEAALLAQIGQRTGVQPMAKGQGYSSLGNTNPQTGAYQGGSSSAGGNSSLSGQAGNSSITGTTAAPPLSGSGGTPTGGQPIGTSNEERGVPNAATINVNVTSAFSATEAAAIISGAIGGAATISGRTGGPGGMF